MTKPCCVSHALSLTGKQLTGRDVAWRPLGLPHSFQSCGSAKAIFPFTSPHPHPGPALPCKFPSLQEIFIGRHAFPQPGLPAKQVSKPFCLPRAPNQPLLELSLQCALLSADPGWTLLWLLTDNGTLGRSLPCSEPRYQLQTEADNFDIAGR